MKLGKFTFTKDPIKGKVVIMEWIEESNYCLFDDEDCDMDITRDEAKDLIKFLAGSLNIDLKNLTTGQGE